MMVKNTSDNKSCLCYAAPHVKGAGVSGSITFGNPADACSSLDLSSSTFLLTMRGNCSFEAKARFAQDAGFAAVIIYNNESGSDLLTSNILLFYNSNFSQFTSVVF